MKTIIYILISFLAIWVLLFTMMRMVEEYPSQGYHYGENLDIGTNLPVNKEIQ